MSLRLMVCKPKYKSIQSMAYLLQRLAGKDSNPPKEFHGGLSGDDLYLFPDGSYIYCEWADIEPLTVRDKSAWKLADGVVVLTSDSDVTWDPGVERKYVAVHRRVRPREILFVGVGRDLSYFEENAKDDPETQLFVVAKERAKTFRHATAAKAKAELMKQSWRPEYFRAHARTQSIPVNRDCPAAYGMSKAIFRAWFNSTSFRPEREPTNCVRSALRRLTRLSHMIQLECLSPSSGPTATWVESPCPFVNTGAQMTVENLESISTCRLTRTKTRCCLGSPPGLRTR